VYAFMKDPFSVALRHLWRHGITSVSMESGRRHPDRLDMDLAPPTEKRHHPRDLAACDMAGHDLVHAG
jgi:hypothetical protein